MIELAAEVDELLEQRMTAFADFRELSVHRGREVGGPKFCVELFAGRQSRVDEVVLDLVSLPAAHDLDDGINQLGLLCNSDLSVNISANIKSQNWSCNASAYISIIIIPRKFDYCHFQRL